MAEYIKREALLADIEDCVRITSRPDKPSAELRGVNKVIDRINAAPAADVVPVVRCKDCKYNKTPDKFCAQCDFNYQFGPQDFFCKAGERRTMSHV